MLAGWLFLAPICGLLSWRPSIWLCGERGSGKTYVGTNIIARTLRSFSICCVGESTEAGIRQKLKGDAFPVVLDEAEGNDEERYKNIARILTMIRQSSSSSGFSVLKGTSGGTGIEYGMTTMFCMLSISPTVEQAADVSRIALLELKMRKDRKAFNKLKNMVDDTLTLEYSNGLVMRALQNWNSIKKTIDIMGEIVAEKHFNDATRMGDQYGTLLAGAWCLKHNNPPTKDEAEKMVSLFDWEDAKIENSDTDAEQCLRRLMQYKLSFKVISGSYGNTSTYEFTIGSLVARLFDRKESQDFANISELTAQTTLREIGLWVHPDVEGKKCFLIQNKHERLSEIYKGSPWPSNWNRILSKLSVDCFIPKIPYRFVPGGKSARVLAIPENILFGD